MGLRIIGFLYFVGAFLTFFCPGELVNAMNHGTRIFHQTLAMPEPVENFWSVYAASGMAFLSMFSFATSFQRRKVSYVSAHLVAKLIAGAAFLYLFFYDKKYFPYILVGSFEILVGIYLLWHLLRSAANRLAVKAPKIRQTPPIPK